MVNTFVCSCHHMKSCQTTLTFYFQFFFRKISSHIFFVLSITSKKIKFTGTPKLSLKCVCEIRNGMSMFVVLFKINEPQSNFSINIVHELLYRCGEKCNLRFYTKRCPNFLNVIRCGVYFVWDQSNCPSIKF